jgi:hypothetical protein
VQWIFEYLGDLRGAILIGFAGALLFELLTVLLRFGLGWTSPERTRSLARLSRGWRVHHGYPGLLLLFLVTTMGIAPLAGAPGAIATPAAAWLGGLAIAVGMTLALSDLVHHAVVLPLLVGRHEFDLRYPGH